MPLRSPESSPLSPSQKPPLPTRSMVFVYFSRIAPPVPILGTPFVSQLDCSSDWLPSSCGISLPEANFRRRNLLRSRLLRTCGLRRCKTLFRRQDGEVGRQGGFSRLGGRSLWRNGWYRYNRSSGKDLLSRMSLAVPSGKVDPILLTQLLGHDRLIQVLSWWVSRTKQMGIPLRNCLCHRQMALGAENPARNNGVRSVLG